VLSYYRFHPDSSRLVSHADRTRIENAVGLMYRCVAERRAGRDLEALLRGSPQARAAADKLPPSVWISIESARLWAGQAPVAFGALCRCSALEEVQR
jgi:hypothetical protein